MYITAQLRRISLSLFNTYPIKMAPSLTLYTASTPNGYKISTYLEFLGLSYEVKVVDISKGEQKEEAIIKMNPDGRVPVLVDHLTGITISQTCAILLYLGEHYDKERKFSYAPGTKEYLLELEILFFHASEQGPPLGQLAHFKLFATEKFPAVIDRFETEVKRVLSVLELYLERNKANGLFFVGRHYCTADIAILCWIVVAGKLGVDVSPYPLLKKWLETLLALDPVIKGMKVPSELKF